MNVRHITSSTSQTKWLSCFKSFVREPMILVLVIIGIVYFFIGAPLECISVIIIVFVVIIIELYNVRREWISLAAMHNMISPRSWIMRNGSLIEIPIDTIVPGDIVYLRTGDRVPGDGIILSRIGHTCCAWKWNNCCYCNWH